MSKRRRIAVITGSRAEFGLLEPVLRGLRSRPSVELRLIVTGMHLLARFGRTIDHIRAAGWRVDAAVRMQTGRDHEGETQALARGIAGLGTALRRLGSEIVVVLGDRIEAFAGACAAAARRRVLVHIHGGDRATGDIDDSLRNAITSLAQVHLVASQDAARRLRRMGEEPRRILKVGAPGLDDILRLRSSMREGGAGSRAASHRLETGPTNCARSAVIVHHAIGRSPRREAAVMTALLQAVAANGLQGAIIYPNSDPGHEGILRAIQSWRMPEGWRVFRSLQRADYLRLAMSSALLVGNSSSGIIESASLGVNAVNVGPRQEGRLRCGPNVIDSGEDRAQIEHAIARALRKARPRPARSVYGDGRAGERIARILERLPLTPELRRKRLTY